jgi:hypothetical protein
VKFRFDWNELSKTHLPGKSALKLKQRYNELRPESKQSKTIEPSDFGFIEEFLCMGDEFGADSNREMEIDGSRMFTLEKDVGWDDERLNRMNISNNHGHIKRSIQSITSIDDFSVKNLFGIFTSSLVNEALSNPGPFNFTNHN